jgi:hypothetical protein
VNIYTDFHRFVTGSDFVAAADGASSVEFAAGSDVGSLLMSLSSNQVYHVTQITMHLHTLSDDAHAHVVSLDSDGVAGTHTSYTIDYGVATAAAKGNQGTFTWDYNPPVRIQYTSNAHYTTLHIHLKDTDAELGCSYAGFTTPAA